jgi:hypothetical protein
MDRILQQDAPGEFFAILLPVVSNGYYGSTSSTSGFKSRVVVSKTHCILDVNHDWDLDCAQISRRLCNIIILNIVQFISSAISFSTEAVLFCLFGQHNPLSDDFKFGGADRNSLQ